MLLVVEDAAARRERVRELLDRAIVGDLPVSRVRPGPLVVEAGPSPQDSQPAARAAHRHLGQLVREVRSLLIDEDAPEELADLGIATVAAMANLSPASWRRRPPRDAGATGARVARCAAEALRAHATVAALPAGAPVPDVPASLLWLICDLSTRLRATGREGRLGRRWDAGVEARDAADLLVTTYRRWRPRLRGVGAEAMARLAVTAAHATVFSGLASIEPDSDDGCGRAVAPVVVPPSLGAAAAAEPPATPRAAVSADALAASR